MSHDFHVKQNDTSPVVDRTLTDENDETVDLAGADVDFHMTEIDGTTVVDKTAVVTDTDGEVEYRWDAEDTTDTGTFLAEFEVTYGDGTNESFPNNRQLDIKITEELG